MDRALPRLRRITLWALIAWMAVIAVNVGVKATQPREVVVETIYRVVGD